jgi:hypothetical protein
MERDEKRMKQKREKDGGKTISRAEYAYLSLSRACYEQSWGMLAELLLQDKIRLSDIPFPLRANGSVYTGALRMSRHYGRFVEDVQIVMDDILQIAAHGSGYLYRENLSDIIRVLHNNLYYYDFGGVRSEDAFDKDVYRPFIAKLQKLLPKTDLLSKYEMR